MCFQNSSKLLLPQFLQSITLYNAQVIKNTLIIVITCILTLVPKKKNAPAPPRIRPFKNTSQKQTPPKPTGPLRISSKMFKKKSPVKKSLNSSKERAGTPDSDVVEILSDNDDDDKPAAGGDGGGGDYSKEAEDDVAADSDVSLE